MKLADLVFCENTIGQGGYGTVYAAFLPDGSKVAVKKINKAQAASNKHE